MFCTCFMRIVKTFQPLQKWCISPQAPVISTAWHRMHQTNVSLCEADFKMDWTPRKIWHFEWKILRERKRVRSTRTCLLIYFLGNNWRVLGMVRCIIHETDHKWPEMSFLTTHRQHFSFSFSAYSFGRAPPPIIPSRVNVNNLLNFCKTKKLN